MCGSLLNSKQGSFGALFQYNKYITFSLESSYRRVKLNDAVHAIGRHHHLLPSAIEFVCLNVSIMLHPLITSSRRKCAQTFVAILYINATVGVFTHSCICVYLIYEDVIKLGSLIFRIKLS